MMYLYIVCLLLRCGDSLKNKVGEVMCKGHKNTVFTNMGPTREKLINDSYAG